MTEDEALVASLRAAVEASPTDAHLRLHFARLLADCGRRDEAVSQAAVVLQQEPANQEALQLIASASQPAAPSAAAAISVPQSGEGPAGNATPVPPGFDWSGAEDQLGGEIVPPMFVEGGDPGEADVCEAERPTVRLADVGGMERVKERLENAFLAPIRYPELRKAFAKSLRGGLLLYGPPGCGKTFIARALAGELEAHFVHVQLNEVLNMYIGESERHLHELFEVARRHVPCVLFIDEVDAIGHKRSDLRTSAMRGVVVQLLAELDNVAASNEGVFVLAATNMPWDVDVALRRPGRFDRTILVLPPDLAAREAILRHHLEERPVAGIDLHALALATEGYSGADLAHICETAAERALIDSARSGQVRFVEMSDLEAAIQEVQASIGPWLEIAHNVAMFANEGGQYDELVAYLKKRKRR